MLRLPPMPAGMVIVSSDTSKLVHGSPFRVTDFSTALPGTRRRNLEVAPIARGNCTCAWITPDLRCETTVKLSRPQRVGTFATKIFFPSSSHFRGTPLPSQTVCDRESSKTSSHFVMSATTSCAGVQKGAAPSPGTMLRASGADHDPRVYWCAMSEYVSS